MLDSTPVLDAVATQDTVTQLRAAVRKVLAALGALDGQAVPAAASDAVDLLALVAGQDVEQGGDGVFRIARKTARDRVISTVDTAARHGHKSRHRRFDGYKAHLSVDPDSELIDQVAATPANTPDREAAGELLDEHAGREDKPEVVGDSAYGDAATRAGLEAAGFTVTAKCPPARNTAGRFAKDRFTVDLDAGPVTCPAGQTAIIVPATRGGGRASFGPWCATCPLRSECTASRRGRTITIHPYEAVLQRARAAQRDPAWQQRYKTGRPIVERKVSHFTRRAWGGRNARTPRPGPRHHRPPHPGPGRSTGPGSRSSASTTTRTAGHCGPREHHGGQETCPSQATSQPPRWPAIQPMATGTIAPPNPDRRRPGEPILQWGPS